MSAGIAMAPKRGGTKGRSLAQHVAQFRAMAQAQSLGCMAQALGSCMATAIPTLVDMTRSMLSLRDDSPRPDARRDVLDRTHAPFAVVRSLDVLGMSAWSHRLLLWLGRYDGFEQRLAGDGDLLLEVRDLLAGYVARGARADARTVMNDLCRLEVLHHRAAWVNEGKRQRRHWMPLQEAWLDFVTQGEADDELRVWWSPQTWPAEDLLRRYLLGG